MARQKGIIKLSGKLDDLIFYQVNGKDYVRSKGSLDKDRVMRDKAFARSREMMKEFGGAATVGGAFRRSLLPWSKKLGETRLTGRLNGLFRKTLGSGIRGHRPFRVREHAAVLRGVEFNREATVNSTCKAKIMTELSHDRESIAVNLAFPGGEPAFRAPAGATHVQLVLLLTTLSDFVWNKDRKKYVPLHPDFQGLTVREVPMRYY